MTLDQSAARKILCGTQLALALTAICFAASCSLRSGSRCVAAGRTLSDAELINTGIDNFIRVARWTAHPADTLSAQDLESLRQHLIATHHRGRFLTEHPGCCSLSMTGTDGSTISAYDAARQPGPYRWVHVELPLGESPANPAGPSRIITTQFLINNCGTSVGTDG